MATLHNRTSFTEGEKAKQGGDFWPEGLLTGGERKSTGPRSATVKRVPFNEILDIVVGKNR